MYSNFRLQVVITAIVILGSITDIMMCSVLQVVLGKPISEIAKRVVEHIRLPLLSPDELKDVDEECQRDRLIAVSTSIYLSASMYYVVLLIGMQILKSEVTAIPNLVQDQELICGKWF